MCHLCPYPMKSYYTLTPAILRLVHSVSRKAGAADTGNLEKPPLELRKQNRIRIVHSSMPVVGNRLLKDQVTAVLENKQVIGPVKDLLEVRNLITLHDHLLQLDTMALSSFLWTHQILMHELLDHPGTYRDQTVRIKSGSRITYVPPPAEQISRSMTELFTYLNDDDESLLIKSCAAHYQIQRIHPFIDGNGRMGRLWQTALLSRKYPVFAFIPIETLVSRTQPAYYAALSLSDRTGDCTAFLAYMLETMDQALSELGKSDI